MHFPKKYVYDEVLQPFVFNTVLSSQIPTLPVLNMDCNALRPKDTFASCFLAPQKTRDSGQKIYIFFVK